MQKPNIWENKQLNEQLLDAIQIITNVNSMVESENDILMLPDSVIETHALYTLCANYIAMYGLLEERGLIKQNFRNLKNIH